MGAFLPLLRCSAPAWAPDRRTRLQRTPLPGTIRSRPSERKGPFPSLGFRGPLWRLLSLLPPQNAMRGNKPLSPWNGRRLSAVWKFFSQNWKARTVSGPGGPGGGVSKRLTATSLSCAASPSSVQGAFP